MEEKEKITDEKKKHIAIAVSALKEAYLLGYRDGIENYYQKIEENFYKGVKVNDRSRNNHRP